MNDFIADGGKLWPYAREVAERVDLLTHLRELLAAARATGTQVIYVPHHRHVAGHYEGWRHLNPTHVRAKALMPFERGTWGADYHDDLRPEPGDIVASEHWLHDGLMNTDLELQLRVRGIERVLVAGMRTNTCVEATARRAVELGHHVAIVKDATAAFRWNEWRATVEVNAPTFAHAILSTAEAIASMQTGAAVWEEAAQMRYAAPNVLALMGAVALAMSPLALSRLQSISTHDHACIREHLKAGALSEKSRCTASADGRRAFGCIAERFRAPARPADPS